MRVLERSASLLLLLVLPALALAQPPAPRGEPEQPLEPRVARQDITIPRIDARDIEIGVYAGVLHLEQFGSNPVFGARLGYHLTEDFFIEANLGVSQADDGAYRRFGYYPFPEEEEDLQYVHVSLGFNALPGEGFVGRGRALSSALFLTTGVGNVSLAEEDYFAFNVGVGFRVLPTDWLTLRIDAREYVFESDVLGESEMTYNLELTAGLAVYF